MKFYSRLTALVRELPSDLGRFKKKRHLAILLLRINDEKSWFTVHDVARHESICPNEIIDTARVSVYLRMIASAGYLLKARRRIRKRLTAKTYLNLYKQTTKWQIIANLIEKYNLVK